MLDYIAATPRAGSSEPLERWPPRSSWRSIATSGFWQNMDTLRDKHVLQELWERGSAPWKVWDRLPALPEAVPAR